MGKSKNALDFFREWGEADPELQRLYEEEEANLHVALAIREARERAHLTQEKLAKLVGTTQSVISRLEDADYEGHSLSMLQRIADALHCRLIIKIEAQPTTKVAKTHTQRRAHRRRHG